MTTKNRTGSKHAAANALGSLDDRVRQLQSLVPGPDGGGSVAAPFSIGGFTFGPGAQIDLTKLADIARPGDRWQGEPFLPTVSQGVTTNVGYDASYSEVLVDHDEVKWNFHLIMTAAGTAGSAVTLTLPRVALRSDRLTYVGQAQIYDASTTTRYGLEAETAATGTVVSFGGDATAGGLWGVTPNLALAVDDQIRGWFSYRPRSSG